MITPHIEARGYKVRPNGLAVQERQLVLPDCGGSGSSFISSEGGLLVPALPKLAIDAHEVLLEHLGRDPERGIIGFLNRHPHLRGGKRRVLPNDFLTYNLAQDLGWAYDYYRSIIRNYQFSIDYGLMLPMPGVPEALKRLCQIVNMTVITATPTFLKDVTEATLDRVFGLETFAGGVKYSANGPDHVEGLGKGAICKALGINMLVEDFPEYAWDAVANGIHVFLHSQIHNKGLEHPLMTRFDHMDQLYDLVQASIARQSLYVS